MLGCGIDVVEVSELEGSMKRFGSAFLSRIFTPRELRYARGKHRASLHLAARFAAKEAVLKAFGPIIRRHPCALQDIEVVNHASGQPSIVLHGNAQRLKRLSGADDIIISLSHTRRVAVATAILWSRRHQRWPARPALKGGARPGGRRRR